VQLSLKETKVFKIDPNCESYITFSELIKLQ
jgi:hypothetical protein